MTANHILARERVLDSFGHISARHPDSLTGTSCRARGRRSSPRAATSWNSRSTAQVVGPQAGKPYSERFIHGAIYEARPDVMAVVHNHSPNVVPFTVTKQKMRPIMHMCGPIGSKIPNWDIRKKFGDTNLLVTSMEMGRDFAKTLGSHSVALMRGHGSTVVGRSVREVVFTSVYMELNAEMLIKALSMGEVTYLSDGEIAAITKGRAGFTFERGWENWCRRVGRPYIPNDRNMGEGFSKTDG